MYDQDTLNKFWMKVDLPETIGTDECWEWQGYRNSKGYGTIKVGRKNKYAHRMSYEICRGPIRDGLYACHTCDNPPCCNPAHLWLGSCADNLRDMAEKGRGHSPRLKGVNNGRSKLTEDDVMAICLLYDRKTTLRKDIAKMFNVSFQQIHSIATGKAWKHLTGRGK